MSYGAEARLEKRLLERESANRRDRRTAVDHAQRMCWSADPGGFIDHQGQNQELLHLLPFEVFDDVGDALFDALCETFWSCLADYGRQLAPALNAIQAWAPPTPMRRER